MTTSLNSKSVVSLDVRQRLEQEQHLELRQTLGSGTYARVRQARCTNSQTDVAVKIIDRRKSKPDFVQHFLPREVELVKRLKHPNIIRTISVLDTQHIVVIVTELARNGDLLQRVRREKRLTEPVSKTLFRQLIEGINYLHSLNIAHRDLKCENVLLDQYDNVKLGDLGFAREMDSISETFCGSRAYAAPEILKAQPYKSCKVDLWSAGVILYIMVTGTMPYPEKHVHRMIKQQEARELRWATRARDVSAAARDLVYQLLNPDIDQRIDHPRMLQHAWLSDTEWLYKTTDIVYVLKKGAESDRTT